MSKPDSAWMGRRSTELDEAVAACRASAWTLAVFGLAINLLMLSSPIYMLQVYDRVMVTGHVETLVMLTGLIAVALLLFGALDSLRSAIAGRMSRWLGERLGPVYLANGVRARLFGGSAEAATDTRADCGTAASTGHCADHCTGGRTCPGSDCGFGLSGRLAAGR